LSEEVDYMEKITKISLLIDFYGGLLTEKQYNIIDLYYNNDFSLSEIAEHIGISRQGVHDTLKRSEELLLSYEKKLKLTDKFIVQNNNIKIITDKLNIIKTHENTNNINEIITLLETMIINNE